MLVKRQAISESPTSILTIDQSIFQHGSASSISLLPTTNGEIFGLILLPFGCGWHCSTLNHANWRMFVCSWLMQHITCMLTYAINGRLCWYQSVYIWTQYGLYFYDNHEQ